MSHLLDREREFHRLESERLSLYKTVAVERFTIRGLEEIIIFWAERRPPLSERLASRVLGRPQRDTKKVYIGQFKAGANDDIIREEIRNGASCYDQGFPSWEAFEGDGKIQGHLELRRAKKKIGDLRALGYIALEGWKGEPPR